MRSSLRLLLTIVFAGLAIGPAAVADVRPARPPVTVEAVVPGCRSLVERQGVPLSSEAGYCSGLIKGLLYLGALLPEDYCFVVPHYVPHDQVVAAILEEIEPVYETVKLEHFMALAIDVLEQTWPCYVAPKGLRRE